MKKKIFITFLITLLTLGNIKFLYGSCWGVLTNWRNNWTVGSNCTISNGIYSVWWVIDVNSRTVTIDSDAALVVDWNDDRMTFTTGKILMSGDAVIYDVISTDGYVPYDDTSTWVAVPWGRRTNCPSGTVYNPITRSSATTTVNASIDGRLACK